MRRVLHVVGRVLLWCTIVLLCIVALVAGVALFALRTSRGQALLLHKVLLPEAQSRLTGKLEIGRLSGSLPGQIVLEDVVLRDRTGMVAVAARRIELDTRVLALVHHRVDVEVARIDGLYVHERPLGGTSNLATLVKPSPQPAQAPSGPSRWRIHVGGIDVAGRVLDDGRIDGRTVAARLALAGAVDHDARALHVVLTKLSLRGEHPTDIDVSVRGVVDQTAPEEIALRGVFVHVHATGAAIDRLDPSLALRGPLDLELHADGGPRGLTAKLELRPRAGTLDVDAHVVQKPALSWHATVRGSGIDPSLWRGMPRGTVDLDAKGDGRDGRGEVVASLRVVAAGAAVAASGRANLDGDGVVFLRARVPDLAAIPMLRAKLDGGSLVVTANARRTRGRIDTDASAGARDLVAGKTRIASIDLALRSHDLAGRLDVVARQVRIGRHRFDRVALTLNGDGSNLALDVSGGGPGTSVSASARASLDLRRRGGTRELRGVRASLDKLALTVETQRYALKEPAHFEYRDGDIRLDHLHLDGPDAHLLVGGELRRSGALRAHVEAHAVHVADLYALYDADAAKAMPPVFVENLAVDAAGTTRAPTGEAKLRLVAGPFTRTLATPGGGTAEEPLVGKVGLAATARYRGGRLSATVHVEGPERSRLVGEVEVPLPVVWTAPAHVLVTFDHLSSQAFGELLPPTWREWAVDASGLLEAKGTALAPVVNFDAVVHAKTPERAHRIDASVAAWLVGKNARVDVRSTLDRALLGTVWAGVELTAPLASAWSSPRPTAPIDGKLAGALLVHGLDLKRIGIAVGKETLQGNGEASATLTGTLRAPRGTFDASLKGLAAGKAQFGDATLHASLLAAVVEAAVHVAESKGGTMDLTATLPLDADQPLAARLVARAFDLQVLAPAVDSWIGELGGRLELDLAAAGTRAAPTLNGKLDLTNGQLITRADGRRYSDVTLDLRVTPTQLVLDKLAAKSNGGDVSAHLTLGYQGFVPQKLDGAVSAHKFGLAIGDMAASLDGAVQLSGALADGTFNGTVKVTKGTLHLPKIQTGGKTLQPTGPLEDVVFVDKAGVRARAKAAQPTKLPVAFDFHVEVPGPFHLRGPEIDTDLSGRLDVRLTPAGPAIGGAVSTGAGWVSILGHRFNIDHVDISFGGTTEIDPALDIEVTRQTSDTTLIVRLSGTANHPHLDLSSDPPVYNESEILALLISDDPGNQAVSDTTLDQKVVGAISGMIVGKLKDAIAPSLPVDVLKVDVGAQGVGTTRVEVGKFITPRIYVSYVHQFGNPNGVEPINMNQASLEWRFARHFELDTTYGDAAVGNADVLWRIRF